MRFLFVIYFLFPLIAWCVEPDFYVWQRQRGENVERVVREYYRKSTGKLYFLAGELENNGTIYSAVPEKYVDSARSVPVIRIHIRHMKKTVSQLSGDIIKLYEPWKNSKALQVDLDAPESKISYYRDLMKELRRRLPGVELSATVLPCHLKHTEEFRTLAEVCDFYVLQVHGLTDNGFYSFILDREIARTALARAKALNLPFKTALPLYCSTVSERRVVTPDLDLVSELAKESPGVIGFRLGTPEDGESLGLQTTLQICRGEGYSPKLELRWEKQKNGAWHLIIYNDGYFAEYKTFQCKWKKSVPQYFRGVFNGAVFSYDRLRLKLPPSGKSRVYFWLRTDAENPSENVQFILERE